ncbi:hypothetical protein KSS87_017995 [Heliosperma pusillum]|nr:hypothetical protein KSS87_017995 [Heliosperma pusillum]
MSSIGTGYDLSVTTFSPDGRVFQIEYAAKALDNSGTVVGIKCKDGIVMGVEKLIQSKMMLPGSNRRIHSVHRHSGMAVAGLAADGRQIVARAKSEATNYESTYGEPIPVKELAERVASYVHLCTLYWWLRPFGCGVILGGYDRDGPQLYMVEPSGISYRYFGAAIGKGKQAAKTEIEKLNLSEMTCREGVIEVAKIIYKVHDEAKDKAFELELSWICEESKKEHQKSKALSAIMVNFVCSLVNSERWWYGVCTMDDGKDPEVIVVPSDLLEAAKTAATTALEEMDAD